MSNTSWFLSGMDTAMIARPHKYSKGEYATQGLYGYPDYSNGQLRSTGISVSKIMQMFMEYGVLLDCNYTTVVH